jgi:hypothetical protein
MKICCIAGALSVFLRKKYPPVLRCGTCGAVLYCNPREVGFNYQESGMGLCCTKTLVSNLERKAYQPTCVCACGSNITERMVFEKRWKSNMLIQTETIQGGDPDPLGGCPS